MLYRIKVRSLDEKQNFCLITYKMHSDGVVNGDSHVFLEYYYYFLIKPAFKKKRLKLD